jgi:hypothetical protein
MLKKAVLLKKKVFVDGTLKIVTKFTTQNKIAKKRKSKFLCRQFCASLNKDFFPQKRWCEKL